VVSGLVLEHLGDLEGFFREARRVLRDGGRAVVSAMHPAMLLRGSQARFTDPESGEIVQTGSFPHQLGDFVMAALRAGFHVEAIGEYAPDARFASVSSCEVHRLADARRAADARIGIRPSECDTLARSIPGPLPRRCL
jgi:cyclopropane fatty-acyl-phospholipid synthase-like methyltransferase